MLKIGRRRFVTEQAITDYIAELDQVAEPEQAA